MSTIVHIVLIDDDSAIDSGLDAAILKIQNKEVLVFRFGL